MPICFFDWIPHWIPRNVDKNEDFRINAAARMNGLSYSKLMHGLKLAEIDINRKMLADLAVNDATAFTALADQAKDALNK